MPIFPPSFTCTAGADSFLPEAQTADRSQPIAVIGIGCRFPGDATNPENFWKLISEGRSALTPIPTDRWNADAFYHPQAERQGTINVRNAHFLKDDIAAFDAPFFSITPQEAKAMDPQQRLMLEVTYETGIRMEDAVGSQTACYVGCFSKDYGDMLVRDPEYSTMYHATGNGMAMLSNRISWFFDLKGPSVSLDTACSSSMVALHLACQSLLSGEASQAIVGGTNLILSPDIMITMCALHFLSPDGKSQSFDHKANGYSRGEGFASVILKPLDAALRDNDVIRAVIRGTALNQDGKTPGITLPSVQAQEQLIRTAYQNAGLDMSETGYFEAHGTGTPAGDPIETEALASTFGKTRTANNPLLVGSVKTNIGHLEGGSGLAGLIKSIYILEKGLIPPNLWFEEANPRILMDQWKLKVPTKLTTWPTDGLRRISVNSFGYGGTNAHAIIDDAYHYLSYRGLKGNHNTVRHPYDSSSPESIDSGLGLSPLGRSNADVPNWALQIREDYFSTSSASTARLLIWSTQDQNGVQRLEQAYLGYLQEKIKDESAERTLERLSYTLGCRRSILPWKTFCVASSTKQVCNSLEHGLAKPLRSSQIPKLGFIFTGQGAQWSQMSKELLSYQVYRASIVDADAYLTSLGCQWSIIDELYRESSSNINLAAYSQPICTAIQVALIELLNHWGVKAAAVVGHSSGEIAAAFCTGAITREAAWKISYHRGRLASLLTADGGMLAVGLGESEVQPFLEKVTHGEIIVACINSPMNVTISGDVRGIDQMKAILDDQGIFARKLKVENAYHSHHMDVIAAKYLESIQDIEPGLNNDLQVKMFSSVSGSVMETAEILPQYWVDNMVSPVRFSHAVNSLLDFSPKKKSRVKTDKLHVDVLVEIGPHAALQGPLKQVLEAKDAKKAAVSYISILHRGKDAVESALDAMGRLFVRGLPLNVARVNDQNGDQIQSVPLVDLPPYPWNKSSRYWFESHLSKEFRFRKHARHDLLGALVPGSKELEPQWRNFIRTTEVPWVVDHRVQSSILYPAAGMFAMAVEAAKQNAQADKEVDGYEFRDVNISKAMIIPQDDEGIETMIQLRPWRLGSQAPTSVWQEFTIFSLASEVDWQEHCSGLLITHYKLDVPAPFNVGLEENAEIDLHKERLLELKKTCPVVESPQGLYESLETIGLHYGPSFRNLVSVRSGDHQAICVLRIPDTQSIMPNKYEFPHVVHPAVLDTIFQMVLPALTGVRESIKVAMMPTSVRRLWVSASIDRSPGDELHGYTSSNNAGFRVADGEAIIYDREWQRPQVIIEGFRCTALTSMTEGVMSTSSTSTTRKLCSQLAWKEDVDHLPHDKAQVLFSKIVSSIQHCDATVVEELELAAFVYIRRVIGSFTLEEAKGFAPHLQLFFEWMQHQHDLATKGLLEHQSTRIDWLNLDTDFESQLLERVACKSVDGKIMCAVGEHLDLIMKQEIEPLQVMLENDLLYDFYRYGVGMAETYAQMVEYVDRVAHKRPNIKILEIGSGTGGTTLPLLEMLGGNNGRAPRFSSYTFTDISTGFFEKAQAKFKEWAPFLTFQKLNIEEDPAAQGFELGSYDMIVAANVLHVSRSMDTTLGNVRSLLKPGGKLVLAEITHMLMRIPMIVGCLSGWWLGEEDGRKWGPTLTESEWTHALSRQGFDGTELCFHDHEDFKDHALSVIISTADSTTNDETRSAPLEEVVIVTPEIPSLELQSLSAKLKKRLLSDGVTGTVASMTETLAIELEGKTCIVLFEVDDPLLYAIGQQDFDAIKRLVLESAGVLWVTKGGALESLVPEANLMTGLSRTICAEHPGMALMTLDLDAVSPLDSENNVRNITLLSASIISTEDGSNQEREYALRDEMLLISRIHPNKELNEMLADLNSSPPTVMLPYHQKDRPLKLGVGVPGMLDSLRFVDDSSVDRPLAVDDVEVKVAASGLNFLDIMVAMGQIQEPDLGVECSGVVTRVGKDVKTFKPGDRVMTWRLGCHQTYVRNPAALFQPIPEAMSFETAASIPSIYCTVYYSLFDAAHLQKGESILIHAAAGGVGQAAIIIAQHIGAEIYATVGNEDKKQLIMEQYHIQEDHIFCSRNLDFAKGIKRMTKGKGVDVVLNSLAGEALRETWHCIARFGRFLELGKKDIFGNTGLDMAPFIRNATFTSVNLLAINLHNVPLASRIFADVMDLVQQGVAKPVHPISVYDYSQVEEAFRFMQVGKHIGKIVLQVNDEDLVPMIPVNPRPLAFKENATYVLAGGLGGLGRSIAQWMADKGVKNLVFISRSGDKKEEARLVVEDLRASGVTASVFACDVSNKSQVRDILEECSRTLPPIKGVIQGAMVLQDSTFDNMTSEDWMAAIRPKVQGSWNLHAHLPQDMDFFVMLSSSAGIGGSRGQGNYAAGNTYQDALAHHRASKGLPATTLDVGMILGVGFVAENLDAIDNLKNWGFMGIREEEFLAILASAITGYAKDEMPIPHQIITGLGTGGMIKQSGMEEEPFWFQDTKFAHMRLIDTQQITTDASESTAQLQNVLSEVTSLAAATHIICEALVAKLARSMMMPLEDLDAAKPANAYGVDSLVAVELRNWVFREVKADVSVFDILSSIPLAALSAKIAAKSKIIPTTVLAAEET
ncbi:hypothetical protein MMC17_007124 [Xylographa soralifera]|nr:hypothetical protein [Xylographa soralifera]